MIKDPKRVTAGKRLAQFSEEAKGRKIRRQIEDERKDESYSFDPKYLYPIAGLAIAGLSIYYTYRQNQREVGATIKEETQIEEPIKNN